METNVIYCGDCLKVMEKIPNNSIDLIYLDPPFFSQKHYENFWIRDKTSKFKFTDKDWEKLRDKIQPNILKQYEDIEKRWKGGHKGIYVYIAYMRERLEQCWRVLKPTGSIYLHCDWHASHYLKQMMDEVFGYNNFQNEIIWNYSGTGKPQKHFKRKHDTILFYTKGKNYVFNILTEPFTNPRTIKRYNKVDKEGRRYKIWTTRGVQRKVYMKEQPLGDVWNIDVVGATSKERLGYPTQKPEKLMERIIKASSNEGDIVLDPFCGCGTTIAVANRLNRKWIGIDISRTACDVIRERLGGKIKIIGGESEKELREMPPHEFARFIIVEKLNGTVNPRKSGDKGIDGWIEFMACPVQVKRWGHKVGRPEIDKFRTAIQREHKKKGMMIAFGFSRDCWNEVERIKKEERIEIKLKTIKEIIGWDKFQI